MKIVIAIALSVPAAYLARESGKHRHQEHKTRKTSLDLRALSPYIATMTPEQQTQIKMDIAAKIFGSSETDTLDKDSYPIHLQEIVLSLIEKIPKQK